MSAYVTFCRSTLLALFVIGLSFSCAATTCIALKEFKVRQVCGQVQTVRGDVVPDATIQVTKKGNSETATRLESDKRGNFAFGQLDEGEYVIQVDVRGFHSVAQDFEIRRPIKRIHSCEHPLIALMQVAGGCSSVAKVRREKLRKTIAQTN